MDHVRAFPVMVFCEKINPAHNLNGRDEPAFIVGFTIGFTDFVAQVPTTDLLSCQNHVSHEKYIPMPSYYTSWLAKIHVWLRKILSGLLGTTPYILTHPQMHY